MSAGDYRKRKGTTPNTSTIISSKVKIYAGADQASQIGVIANFDPSESRSAEAVRGIGFGDQIAELVPGVTEPISISVGRTAQYTMNLYQAFGYKGGVGGLVRSLKHHRWPVDITQDIVVSWLVNSDVSKATTAVDSADEHDHGLAEYSKSYSATDDMVTETFTTDDHQKAVTGFDGEGNLQAIRTIYEACWFTDWNTSFTSDTAIVQESCTLQASDVYDAVDNILKLYTSKDAVINQDKGSYRSTGELAPVKGPSGSTNKS